MTNRLNEFAQLALQCDEFVVVDSTGSTNTWLREQRAGSDACTIVVTDNQTHGRGRMSRTWVSRPGESLALSIGIAWLGPEHDGRLSWLPLVVGAALVRALRESGVGGAALKWPNDVLVKGAKLAGILCEVAEPGRVIIGVGLNLDFSVDSPPSPNATALSRLGNFSPEAIDHLLAVFVSNLRQWVSLEHSVALQSAQHSVPEVMETLGRHVEVLEVDGSRWAGAATGLDRHGHLVVAPVDGSSSRVVVASDIRHLYQ